MKNALIIILVSISLLGGIWGLSYFGLIHYKFFAPKYENARRQVFEQTQSYVEGKRQEVLKYKLEYELVKTEREKKAIKYIILNTTANLNLNLLSPDLKKFVLDLRNN